jgi:hypothetical protein
MRNYRPVVLGFLFAILALSAQAQIQPSDSIRVKEQLPSGLPGEGQPLPDRRVPPPPVRSAPPGPVVRRPAPVSQPQGTGTLREKLYLAGNMGLNLFGRVFFVEASPMVGYKITDKFSVGPGISYQYISTRNYSYSNYGVKGFARFLFIPSIFAHVEHEVLNVPYNLIPGTNGRLQVDKRVNVNSTFVGAGYRQQFSARAASDIMILFNLQQNELTPYSNPVLRVGFYFDL